MCDRNLGYFERKRSLPQVWQLLNRARWQVFPDATSFSWRPPANDTPSKIYACIFCGLNAAIRWPTSNFRRAPFTFPEVPLGGPQAALMVGVPKGSWSVTLLNVSVH